jgi:hypothetical protein
VEIIFEVTEDPIDGGFVASALGHGITTEADTLTDCVRWLKMLSNAISTMQNKCQRLFACISSVTKSCRYEAAGQSRRKPAVQLEKSCNP